MLLVAIVVIIIIGYFFLTQTKHQEAIAERANIEAQQDEQEEKAKDAIEDQKAGIRGQIRDLVTANINDFAHDNTFGGIWGLKVTVTNSTNSMIDKVRVKVSYIKENGDVYKDEFMDFTYLKPNTKTTIDAPTSKRGMDVKYEILKIQSTDLDLK